jgi:hypothetical protein
MSQSVSHCDHAPGSGAPIPVGEPNEVPGGVDGARVSLQSLHGGSGRNDGQATSQRTVSQQWVGQGTAVHRRHDADSPCAYALDGAAVEIVDWQCRQIHGGSGGIAELYRLNGSACDQRKMTPWSLILKVIRRQPDRLDPSHWGYWKREALAYQSGLLDDLPGGLAAPRCFSVTEQPGGGSWLWLEEVSDELRVHWPLEHYGIVVRHLGRFNGPHLAEGTTECSPWLGREWLRRCIDREAQAITQLPRLLGHPLGQRGLPGDDGEALVRLWNTRETFYEALSCLPQTLCHRDALRRNLFARHQQDGSDETVAIDWADVSQGAIGEEIVPLVLATLQFAEIDPAKVAELGRIVFEGYLGGLCDSGWQGDPREVRLGYAAGAIRHALAGFTDALLVMLDEEHYAYWEQAYGCPLEEVADRFAQNRRFVFCLLEEARELLDSRS